MILKIESCEIVYFREDIYEIKNLTDLFLASNKLNVNFFLSHCSQQDQVFA